MSRTQAQRGDEYWKNKQEKGSWTPSQTVSDWSKTQAQRGDEYWKQKQAAGSWAPTAGASLPSGKGQNAGDISGVREQNDVGLLNDYRRYLSDSEENAKSLQKKAIEQAEKRLNNQIPEIRQEAEEAIRQANINKMLSLRDMPQQLAAMGSSGGMTDSAVLGLNTAYENSRNEITKNRDKAIQTVRDNIEELRASGDTSLARIENQYRQALAQRAIEMGLYGSLYGGTSARAGQGEDMQQKRRHILNILHRYGVDDEKTAEIFNLLELQ